MIATTMQQAATMVSTAVGRKTRIQRALGGALGGDGAKDILDRSTS